MSSNFFEFSEIMICYPEGKFQDLLTGLLWWGRKEVFGLTIENPKFERRCFFLTELISFI